MHLISAYSSQLNDLTDISISYLEQQFITKTLQRFWISNLRAIEVRPQSLSQRPRWNFSLMNSTLHFFNHGFVNIRGQNHSKRNFVNLQELVNCSESLDLMAFVKVNITLRLQYKHPGNAIQMNEGIWRIRYPTTIYMKFQIERLRFHFRYIGSNF